MMDMAWMLCVLSPYKETAYWFDPLGFQVMDDFKSIIETAMKMWLSQINLNRPKKSVKWIEVKCPSQPNNTDCGYYLRYMLDIIRMEQDSYPGESYQQYGSNPTNGGQNRRGSRSMGFFCAEFHALVEN